MSAAILLAAGIATFAGVQPQLAAGGGAVYVTFAAGDVISVARSTDAGATFTSPVALPEAGKLALGRHRGPRVAATARRRRRRGDRRRQGRRRRRRCRPLPLHRSAAAPGRRRSSINDVPGAAREGLHGSPPTPPAWSSSPGSTCARRGPALRRDLARSRRDVVAGRLVYASPSGSMCECCHPSVAVGGRRRASPSVPQPRRGPARHVRRPSRATARPSAPAVKQGTRLVAARGLSDGRRRDCASARTVHERGLAARGDDLRCRRRPRALRPSGPETALGAGRDPVVAPSRARRIDVAWTGADGIAARQHGRRRRGPRARRFRQPRWPCRSHRSRRIEHQGRVAVHVVRSV